MKRALLPGLSALLIATSGCMGTNGDPPASAASLKAGTLTGTLSYRERIALPPDAVATVTIADVARADAPSRTIAQVRIPTEGRQVPIPFTLAYPADRPGTHADYAVQARIEGGDGALLFITDTRNALPADGKSDLWLVRATR